MKKYNALFSQESVALYQMSHTDLEKIDKNLSNFLPLLNLPCLKNFKRIKSILFRNFNLPKLCNTSCLSCTILRELNPYYLGILAFQNCAIHHGHPNGFFDYAPQSVNNTIDS